MYTIPFRVWPQTLISQALFSLVRISIHHAILAPNPSFFWLTRVQRRREPNVIPSFRLIHSHLPLSFLYSFLYSNIIVVAIPTRLVSDSQNPASFAVRVSFPVVFLYIYIYVQSSGLHRRLDLRY